MFPELESHHFALVLINYLFFYFLPINIIVAWFIWPFLQDHSHFIKKSHLKLVTKYGSLFLTIPLSLIIWWWLAWLPSLQSVTPINQNLVTLATFNCNPTQVDKVTTSYYLGFTASILVIVATLAVSVATHLLVTHLFKKKQYRFRSALPLVFFVVFYVSLTYLGHSVITFYGDRLTFTQSNTLLKAPQTLAYSEIQSIDFWCYRNPSRSVTTYSCDLILTSNRGVIDLEPAIFFTPTQMNTTIDYLKELVPLTCRAEFRGAKLSYANNETGILCSRKYK